MEFRLLDWYLWRVHLPYFREICYFLSTSPAFPLTEVETGM